MSSYLSKASRLKRRQVSFRCDQNVMLLGEETDVTEAPGRAINTMHDQLSIVEHLVSRCPSFSEIDATDIEDSPHREPQPDSFVDCEPTENIFRGSYGDYKNLQTKTAGLEGCDGKILKNVMREVKLLMSNTPHPNIQDLVKFAVAYDRLYIVSRACYGEDLRSALGGFGIFSEAQARAVMAGIFRGLSHLHSQGVAHRDIKLENVIVTEEGDLSSVKIIDIGFAKKLCPQEARDEALHAVQGTPLYIAPEEIQTSGEKKVESGTQVDMWACGVIMATLLSGLPPFSADGNKSIMREVFADIKKGRIDFDEHLWQGVSESAMDLILSLLDVNPERRLGPKEALRHPWFRKCNESAEAYDLVVASARVRIRQSDTTMLRKKTTSPRVVGEDFDTMKLCKQMTAHKRRTLTLYKKALLNQVTSLGTC